MAEGSARRLPLWMLDLTTASDDNGKTHVGDKKRMKAVNSNTADAGTEEKPSLMRNSLSQTKSEMKRGKNIRIRHHTNKKHDHDMKSVPKKKYNKLGRKIEQQSAETATSKNLQEIHFQSPTDDKKGLTVEDLVSIAKEYVKANEDSEQKRSSHGECDAQRRPPKTAISNNETEGSFTSCKKEQTSPHAETTSLSSSTVSLRGEENFITTSRTGDPTQDMLNLFLGPLLSKPLEEESRTEFIAKDVKFGDRLKQQGQTDFGPGEEMTPPMKKRSSLKDKVSLLFN